MSIEITLKFATIAEAQGALAKLGGSAPAATLAPAAATLVSQSPTPVQRATNGATAPAPQPAQQVGGATTAADVNKAFQAYLAKGQGRTAKVAMDTILGPFGLKSVKDATAEQLPQLLAAFVEATKDKAA